MNPVKRPPISLLLLLPLAFGGTPEVPTFTVSVDNAVSGVWYTVYASDNVATGFAAVLSTNAPADGVLSIPVDASDPAKFIRVKPSLAPVPAETPL